MCRGARHHRSYSVDERGRHILVEQVRPAVHEGHPRPLDESIEGILLQHLYQAIESEVGQMLFPCVYTGKVLSVQWNGLSGHHHNTPSARLGFEARSALDTYASQAQGMSGPIPLSVEHPSHPLC